MKRIPSLDGLRAFSITLVVLNHLWNAHNTGFWSSRYWVVIANGGLGVHVFFVISGFLITSLLLEEFAKRDDISLRRFYLRRTLRIFPPIYAYLLFLIVTAGITGIHPSATGLASAGLFIWNYSPWTSPAAASASDWPMDHTWSLSVEEQFYLLWPLALLFLLRGGGKARAAKAALWIIGATFFFRVGTMAIRTPYFLHRSSGMLHCCMDGLMFGCYAALASGTLFFERVYRHAVRYWFLLPTTFLIISGILFARYTNYYMESVGASLDGAAIMLFMIWCIRNPGSWAGRMLNLNWVRHVGVLSYSIYIWQTYFLHEKNTLFFAKFPSSLLCIVLLAELSYWAVERPCMGVRGRLERRIFGERGGKEGRLPTAPVQ